MCNVVDREVARVKLAARQFMCFVTERIQHVRPFTKCRQIADVFLCHTYIPGEFKYRVCVYWCIS